MIVLQILLFTIASSFVSTKDINVSDPVSTAIVDIASSIQIKANQSIAEWIKQSNDSSSESDLVIASNQYLYQIMDKFVILAYTCL